MADGEKEHSAVQIVKMIICTITGLLIMAGAAYAYKFMDIDGFIAFLIASGGFSVIGCGLKKDWDLW